MRSERVQVFAVVRLDLDAKPGPLSVSIKEVVVEEQEAEREVQRLNELNGGDSVEYFWQATRFYPSGRNIEESSQGP